MNILTALKDFLMIDCLQDECICDKYYFHAVKCLEWKRWVIIMIFIEKHVLLLADVSKMFMLRILCMLRILYIHIIL